MQHRSQWPSREEYEEEEDSEKETILWLHSMVKKDDAGAGATYGYRVRSGWMHVCVWISCCKNAGKVYNQSFKIITI